MELAAFDHREDLLDQLGVALLVLRDPAAPVDTGHPAVAEQDLVGGKSRDAPRRKPEDEQLPVVGERPQSLLGQVAADRVVHEIETNSRELTGPFLHVLRGRVDHIGGAERAGEVPLVGRRRTGDDGEAEGVSDVDRGEPDPAPRAEDEDRLPCFGVGAFTQCEPCGQVALEERGDLAVAQRDRGRHHLRHPGDHLLREPAGEPAGGEHPIAEGHGVDAFTDLDDGAGDLAPGDERQRRLQLVQPLGEQGVHEVDAGGGDLDPHGARAARRALPAPRPSAGRAVRTSGRRQHARRRP